MSGDLFAPAVQPSGPHSAASAPETSAKAAERVRPALPPIRERILALALQAGATGFQDGSLMALADDERHFCRSIVPRRTELADEGWLADSGRRALNERGNECVVWIHRDFAPAPPPLGERAHDRAKGERDAGRAMAPNLAAYARQMKAEGRTLFAGELEEAARLMAALAG